MQPIVKDLGAGWWEKLLTYTVLILILNTDNLFSLVSHEMEDTKVDFNWKR